MKALLFLCFTIPLCSDKDPEPWPPATDATVVDTAVEDPDAGNCDDDEDEDGAAATGDACAD
jgi:hypothetical protein